jgi:hypothetical protein
VEIQYALVLATLRRGVEIPCTFLLLILDWWIDAEVTWDQGDLVDLGKSMEGRGCKVGGLVFGLFAWRAALRGVVEQTLYSRVFFILDRTWLDIGLFLWCWVAWVHGTVDR